MTQHSGGEGRRIVSIRSSSTTYSFKATLYNSVTRGLTEREEGKEVDEKAEKKSPSMDA